MKIYTRSLFITIFLFLTSSLFAQATAPFYPGPAEYGIPISVTVSWTAGSGTADSIEIYTDSAMQELVYAATLAGGTSHPVSGLSYNTKYYWRVHEDVPAWSVGGLWEFTTQLEGAPALGFPTNLTEISSDPTYFSWWYVYGPSPTGYAFEIASDDAFSTVVEDDTISASQKPISISGIPLTVGATYYWRVRSLWSANFSSWSDADSFKVSEAVGPVKPTIWYPKDSITVYQSNPWFSWSSNSIASGLTYEVEISEDDGASFDPVDTVSYTLAQVDGSKLPIDGALLGGKTYSWRVRAYDGTTYSEYSDTAAFTMYAALAGTPIQPINAWPVDSALVYSTTATLYWYTGHDATGLTFEYEVDLIADAFSGTPDNSTTDLFVEVTGLTAGEAYHWRVRSTDGTTDSDWSVADTFAVVASLDPDPPLPVLSWPVGGAEVYTVNPTLSWYTETYVAGIKYRIQYSDSYSGFVDHNTPVPVDTTSQMTQISGLTPGTSYYWRARSFFVADTTTTSAWTDVDSFLVVSNINEGPQQPILASPTGNIAVDSNSVEYFWYVAGSTTGLTYDLEYKLDYQNWSVATTVSGLTDATYGPVAGLTKGSLYRWRVKSIYAGVESAWSTEGVFLVNSDVAPIQPLVGSPAGGVKLETASPTLSWFTPGPENGDVTYNVVVSTTPDMATTVVHQTNLDAKSLQLSGLESNKTYFWQVQSTNADGVSEFSKAGVFGTLNITGLTDETIPNEFSVYQNFPNPFNPSTIIKYSIPEATFVSVKVFNILGQEVRSLINQEMTAGNHQVIWNGRSNFGSALSTGIYIYSVKAGSKVISKKMMLLK